MRYIYECLDGDDGLLQYDKHSGRSFKKDLLYRDSLEISENDENIKCELCDVYSY